MFSRHNVPTTLGFSNLPPYLAPGSLPPSLPSLLSPGSPGWGKLLSSLKSSIPFILQTAAQRTSTLPPIPHLCRPPPRTSTRGGRSQRLVSSHFCLSAGVALRRSHDNSTLSTVLWNLGFHLGPTLSQCLPSPPADEQTWWAITTILRNGSRSPKTRLFGRNENFLQYRFVFFIDFPDLPSFLLWAAWYVRVACT